MGPFPFMRQLVGLLLKPTGDERSTPALGGTENWGDAMSPINAAIAGFAAILVFTDASAQTATCTASADIACTEQGAVRGVVQAGTLAFKGIPYAAAPVGPLRWKPSASPLPWEGVRDGSRFGAMCPQIVGDEVKGDEDCLYINVWRPRAAPAKPLPVMVWLTGGGNHSQSGEGGGGYGGVAFNGEQLVPHGVVFVSFNYRLGALGFLVSLRTECGTS